ncbi:MULTISPECIES: helix-turn-helix transcriptional regulator [Pseudomonadaceae]|jgi:AraC-like DNA-binding protein|uniref:AraC family transcriptional regulator n=2 Tax=Aquipseudomonas alcaligenes TaxID=43263 RepID=A0AA37FLH7_AQUAC|nr:MULTISPECIES: AraC family transcriptional regulator [Pseudomonas]AMR66425.1 AraC family transcriptional regulator [Pseudomonas alcaligenes]MDC7824479.1 AraC family transcriptional regulator [Pseudomonas sp. BLCC-B13]MDH0143359.1 AraC family transcriptional regulator [Pseudomonas alcaligenes]MDH1056723.1 AraC family transcriptional regulator [Pseudomonas alcaligenes]MEE1947482.1 AraC family transcriptional regulator [Pseudomonas alcaligenes]
MLTARLACLDNQAHEHAHDYHQLVLSLSGRAEFEVDGCGGEVCRMRACLVPGDAEHQFAGMGDNRMLILDLDERDTSPEDLSLLAELFESPRYPTLDADFQNLLSYAGAELARYGSDPHLARALGGVLLRALHLRLFGERGRSAVAGLDIGRLDAYIVEHLARRITVIELAQVACLSPSHFHAQFKDSVGLTPHQYLLKTRLDHAARLLRESPLPLVRIAEECGFSSQSALTTAMRRYLGLTPKRLRGLQ